VRAVVSKIAAGPTESVAELASRSVGVATPLPDAIACCGLGRRSLALIRSVGFIDGRRMRIARVQGRDPSVRVSV